MYKFDLVEKVREWPPEDWDLPMGVLAARCGVEPKDIAEAINYIKAHPQSITMSGGLRLPPMGESQ
jgi:hypothetical protein